MLSSYQIEKSSKVPLVVHPSPLNFIIRVNDTTLASPIKEKKSVRKIIKIELMSNLFAWHSLCGKNGSGSHFLVHPSLVQPHLKIQGTPWVNSSRLPSVPGNMEKKAAASYSLVAMAVCTGPATWKTSASLRLMSSVYFLSFQRVSLW